LGVQLHSNVYRGPTAAAAQPRAEAIAAAVAGPPTHALDAVSEGCTNSRVSYLYTDWTVLAGVVNWCFDCCKITRKVCVCVCVCERDNKTSQSANPTVSTAQAGSFIRRVPTSRVGTHSPGGVRLVTWTKILGVIN
jgi:hypothetical protein